MKLLKKATVEAADNILAFSWSGETLVATPATGPTLVLNTAGESLAELPEHGLGNGAASANATTVATCGFDGKISLYSLADLSAAPKQIKLGKGWIERVKWSPDGQYLAASLGKTLYVLDAQGETVWTTADQNQTAVADFAWNPTNSRELVTVGAGGARMWRVGELASYAKFDWGGASLLAAWSPVGRWIVTADQTASVHLYDFARDYPLHIQGYETKVKAMDFTPDGERLATGGGPMVTVWDCTGETGPEGTTPAQLQFHKGDVEAIAWSRDGELLVTGDTVGRLVLSNKKGKPTAAFENEGGVSAVAWSPNGQWLSTGNTPGLITILSLVS